MIPLPILMITQICFGINCPGIWFPWMQYALTEPLFLYAWTYYCLIVKQKASWVPVAISMGGVVLAQLCMSTALSFTTNPEPGLQAAGKYIFLACGILTPAANFLAAQGAIF